MNANEIIIINFSEIRRRSIKIWEGIPTEHYNWQPDKDALTVIEMIRHVLQAEHLFHIIINNRGNLGDYVSPWDNLEIGNVENELKFAQQYHDSFLNMIKNCSESDFENILIKRTEKNQIKKLGDYLNRIAYHESVHAGQMLDYLRTIGIDRPQVWD